MNHIFYSWQTDTPERTNRYLIRDALSGAVKELARAIELDEATRGVSGTPPIFSTILAKIDRCTVFVADLTLVPLQRVEEFTCNPNVLIEYGYALAKKSERRLIPVINTAFGPIEKLPFDLRDKAIRVAYNLAENATTEDLKRVSRELVGRLRSELRMILEDPTSTLNLAESEVAVARHLLTTSLDGAARDYLEQEEIARAAHLDLATTYRAIADLSSRGYLDRLPVAGTDSPPVKATCRLFWDLDPYVHGWDARHDARAIAEDLVAGSHTGNGRLSTLHFQKTSGWPLRRLNPALLYLTRASIVRESSTVVPDLVTLEIFETDRTRAFLRGTYDPEGRRRG